VAVVPYCGVEEELSAKRPRPELMETEWPGDMGWVPGESAVVFNLISPIEPSGT
jgi:hypothetical protein